MNVQDLSYKLELIIGSIAYMLPEIMIAIAAIVVLLIDIVVKNISWKIKTGISSVFLLIVCYISAQQQRPGELFDGILMSDGISMIFEVIILITGLLALLFPYVKNDVRNLGEYHFLVFTLILGALLMSKSQDLLVFYLALETISISSYILTSLGLQKKGFEAGIKYLLFGALASGVMLYGISLLYGLSGSLLLSDIFQGETFSEMHYLALFLMSVGILFKLSMIPMHIWAPDVYEAAPTSVVGIFSVIPKLAALLFLFRIMSSFDYLLLQNQMAAIVSWLAIGTMFLGNLGAIWQGNAKRLMAYSSIAHAGFLIIGVIVNSEFGMQSLVLYSVVYALMNIGTFYFIALMETQSRFEIADYKGIGKSFPILAVITIVLMISLTGLPPTGGFTAKFLLFSALWTSYETSGHDFMFWLFIFGLLNTVIALFYYLKIPYFSIFKSSEKSEEIAISLKDKVLLAMFGIAILYIFFRPDFLFDLTNKINFALSYLP